MTLKRILIDGEWRDTGQSFAVRSPFSQDLLGEVATATENDVEHSLSAATTAAGEMRKLSRFEIAKALRAIAQGIEKRKEEFARSICLEAAKPIIYARGEVERGIATFALAAGESERFAGDVIPVDVQPNGRSKSARTLKIPRGVVYGITPFNFPLNLVAHKVAPALASKNAIIIKPSPRTPLTALLLGEVFLESGLPSGALQIVPADIKYISGIIDDHRVGFVSFTGSAHVGWDLKDLVGRKPIALELGGNAPVIVDKSVDIERSLSRTLPAAFGYSGQVCISVQRAYVHSSLFDSWTSELVERAKTLNVGDPSLETTQLSVMIDKDAAKRAESWIREATANGAELLTGGNREGSMLDATILTKTSPEMRVVGEEAFAPIMIVEPFDHFDDALRMANNTRYGLQAGVFSRDQANILRAGELLEFGGVMINDAPNFRVDNMPYGGVKESGFGREGVRYAMEEMTELRLIVEES